MDARRPRTEARWKGEPAALRLLSRLVVGLVLLPIGCRASPLNTESGGAGAAKAGAASAASGAARAEVRALEAPAAANTLPVIIRFHAPPPAGAAGFAAELWQSADGGGRWSLAALDPAGSGEFAFSAPDGSYALWARWRDAGAPAAAAPPAGEPPMAALVIDTRSPVLRIRDLRAAPEPAADGVSLGGWKLRLAVEADGEPVESLREIAVYAGRADGRGWRLLGTAAAAALLEMPLESPGRLLGLRAVGLDRAGNRGSPPEEGAPPDRCLALGVPPFELRLVSLEDAGVLAGGSRRFLFFEVFPRDCEQRPARMALSYSHTEAGSWTPIAGDLAFVAQYLWQVPRETGEDFRLRVDFWDAGGLQGTSFSERGVAIDSTPPRARVTRAESLGERRVLIECLADEDRPAGVDRIFVYRRSAGAWGLLGSAGPRAEPWIVSLPPGVHELKAAAEDRAGNRQALPEADDLPDLEVRVAPDEAPPALALENFHGGWCRGGERRYVFWRWTPGAGELVSEAFDLCWRADGGDWQPLVSGLPAAARHWAWELPAGSGARAWLRLRARLRDGRTLESASALAFRIESRPPAVRLEGPPVSTSRRVQVGFCAWSPAPPPPAAAAVGPEDKDNDKGERVPLDRVECYLARGASGAWFLAGTWKAAQLSAEASGSIPIDVDDGEYRVALAAWDLIGNRSLDLAGGATESGRLIVDTIKPRLEVSIREQKPLYLPGEELLLDIAAADAQLGGFPAEIALFEEDPPAADGTAAADGPTAGRERVLEPLFPARGERRFQAPSRPGAYGLRVRVRDRAGNLAEFEHRFRVGPASPEKRIPRRGAIGGIEAVDSKASRSAEEN